MSNYSGRHRPLTRAERRSLQRRSILPKSLTPAYALPTAAAVALALTAAGATAAQSSPFGGDGTSAFSAGSAAESAAALLDDADTTEDARSQVAADSRDTADLTERRQEASSTVATGQGRTESGTRAGRSESRQERDDATKERSGSAATTSSTRDSDSDSEESSSSTGWVEPLDDTTLTSTYGHRWGRLHAGHDYAADVGTPLKSMGRGEVVGAGPMSGYGKYIDIRYTDGTVSRYGHIDSFSASVGQKVSPGDVVAKSGNTGQSTGPHLHLEIRPGGGEPIDPADWLAERGLD